MCDKRLTKITLSALFFFLYLFADCLLLPAEASEYPLKNKSINTYTVDYIDKAGELIISLPEQEHILYFSDDLALMQKDGKLVYIDRTGKAILEPAKYYSNAGPFAEGLAAVRLALAWGYINKDGDAVIKPLFRAVGLFHEGLAAVQPGAAGWGYINKKGRLVVPADYQKVKAFSEGLAPVMPIEKLHGWGYINTKAELVIEPQYSEAESFSEGLAAVKVADNQWGYIEQKGNLTIPAKYQGAKPFSDGLAAVQINGRWGYIDKNGMQVVGCRYSAVHSFADGRAAVCLYDRWGFINREGKMVVPAKYLAVADFYKGFAGVIGESQE